MSYKLLKVSSYYRDFLEYYYRLYPEIVNAAYHEQHLHLMEQYFAWSDNYAQILGNKGIEVMEIVANASPLQQAWQREFGQSRALTASDILMAQIKWFKPEVIYFQDSVTYNGSFVEQIREKCPSVKLVVGNLCAPFSSMQIEGFMAFDFFTVCSPFFSQALKRYGIDSCMIPHAFDGRILTKINENNPYPETPFIFLGSIFADEGFHSVRRQLLEELVNQKIDFSFYGNLPDKNRIGLLKRQASYLAATSLTKVGLRKVAEAFTPIRKGLVHEHLPRGLKLSPKLYQMVKSPLFGLEMFKALSKSRIGFNIHLDCAGNYAANMRMYETTGVGACLVTDWKSNLHEFFDDNSEIVSYKTQEECIEKVKWLIDHPVECAEIARKGQQRTLRDHNFENRVNILSTEINKRL